MESLGNPLVQRKPFSPQLRASGHLWIRSFALPPLAFFLTFASCPESFLSLEHSPSVLTDFPSLNPPAWVHSPKVTSSSVLVAPCTIKIRKLIWGETHAGLYPFVFDFPSCFSLVICFPNLVMCCLRITRARENEY